MIGTQTYSPHDGEVTHNVVPYAIRWAVVDGVVFEIQHDGRIWTYCPDLRGLLRLAGNNLTTADLTAFVERVSDFMLWEGFGLFSGVRMRLGDIRTAIESVQGYRGRWIYLRNQYAELTEQAGGQ